LILELFIKYSDEQKEHAKIELAPEKEGKALEKIPEEQ
jgi:hypothetical protein